MYHKNINLMSIPLEHGGAKITLDLCNQKEQLTNLF